MPVQVEYYPMEGALDVVTPHFKLISGQMIECGNYEAYPEGGYGTIDGYVLYDGQETAEPVPGTGPIRGVAVFKNMLYAVRDQDETDAAMFVESASGWQEVLFGDAIDFDDGEATISEGDTIEGATSGATATVGRVVFSGGSNDQGTALGRLTLTGITGTFQVGEDLEVSSSVVATAATANYAQTLPAGGKYTFESVNYFGADGLDRLYGANGIGDAFEFDGTLVTFIRDSGTDSFPAFVVAHKQHLMLGYREGFVKNSGTGEPLLFDSLLGADEIGVGDAVTGLQSLSGGVLAVFCQDSTQMLYGDNNQSWSLQQFTDHGAKEYSFAEIGGNVLVLDDRGVQDIRASAAYGDFETISQSRKINPLILDARIDLKPTAAVVSKLKSQYRLFFGVDCYYFTYAGSQMVGATVCQYADPVYVTAVGENAEGKEIIYFGSDDGKVFKMNTGYNFAGEPIVAFFRVPFNFQKAPTQMKQYRKAELELQTRGDSAPIFVRADYDYIGAGVPVIPVRDITPEATGGGTWDFSDWNEFNWDAPFYSTQIVPLAGIARNMSLSFATSGTDGGHTIFSAAVHYSMRRLRR